MSKISFAKFQAAGNDFILIDNRDGRFPVGDPLLVQKMCHRQFGIGADGLILLGMDPQDARSDFQMRIFNNDGREASSCGNGLRCLVRFLRDLGVVQKKYKIRTQEKVVMAFLSKGHPVIDLGPPDQIRCELETEAGIVHGIDTGVPHIVQFVSDVDLIDVDVAGAFLRQQLSANVNFATLQPDQSIRVRTFERGVEGETLSCGTGAAAAATLAVRQYGFRWPIPVFCRGGRLEVWEEDGRIFLSGPAEKVFTGVYP